MSPRKLAPTHITLPPRVNLALSLSSDSTQSSLSPHTPHPYGGYSSPDIDYGKIRDAMSFDEEAVVGQKRAREEEPMDAEWTEDEVETLQATLIHPFRPISTPYPPGELPPKEVLDELTDQILSYAITSAPSTSTQSRFSPSPSGSSSSSPITTNHTIPMIASTSSASAQNGTQSQWKHTWAATRKRLFELALADSNFGKDDVARKLSRADRKAQRPGLKRMDSMDFLDQAGEETTENIGRALRLSTCLQNSAKTDTLVVAMQRSPSAGSSLITDPMAKLSSSSPTTCAAITLTPPSPQPGNTPTSPSSPASPSPNSTSSTTSTSGSGPISQAMRRRGSNRSNPGSLTRPSRPSLLQRGKSFTASDLQAESNGNDNSPQKLSSSSGSGTFVSPIKEMSNSPVVMSPGSPTPTLRSPTSPTPTSSAASMGILGVQQMRETPAVASINLQNLRAAPPRLTRSTSSTTVNTHPPNSLRNAFLAHQPALPLDSHLLAKPLQLGKPPAFASGTTTGGGGGSGGGGGGWSDSEDETTSIPQRRSIKKMKGSVRGKLINARKVGNNGGGGLTFGSVLGAQMMGLEGLGDGLRSPFEERGEIHFSA